MTVRILVNKLDNCFVIHLLEPAMKRCLTGDLWCTFQILGYVRIGGQGWGDNNIKFIILGGWVTKVLMDGNKKYGEGWWKDG